MATPDKSLFHEVEDLNPSKEEQERIRRKQAVAKLQDSPAIQKQIRKTRVAKDQVKVRDQSRKTNARLEAERKAKLKAKEDAKKNTVNYSDATKPKKTTPEKKPAKKGLFGEGDAKTRNGKANVSRKQLSDFGGTLTQYMNQWNKSGKRPTKVSKDASGSGTKTDAPAKKTFRQRRAANLKAKIADENVGEGRKRRLKRRLGRVEIRMAQGKAGGGMMKSKMASKGGMMKAKGMAKGGKMAKKGYASGGVAKKPVPPENKGLKKLPKDVRNKMGYMKGGGMAKKGYSKGGAVKKKGSARGGKPRGVGVALRGYGKAMR